MLEQEVQNVKSPFTFLLVAMDIEKCGQYMEKALSHYSLVNCI
jgi:hypothetical protein